MCEAGEIGAQRAGAEVVEQQRERRDEARTQCHRLLQALRRIR